MKNIIFLFIVIFSTALFGCNKSSENKIPPAGTVRGKTMDIEPFDKKDEKQQIIINSGGRSDQIKNFTFN